MHRKDFPCVYASIKEKLFELSLAVICMMWRAAVPKAAAVGQVLTQGAEMLDVWEHLWPEPGWLSKPRFCCFAEEQQLCRGNSSSSGGWGWFSPQVSAWGDEHPSEVHA